MKEIKLTKGKIALVDDEDYEFLMQWKWSVTKGRYTFYAERVAPIDGRQKKISMHRLILGLTDPNIEGDHIDHNGLNNQRSNLRAATCSQQSYNRRNRKNSLSKYKGVCFHKAQKKWVSRISVPNKRIHLGYFDTELEAAFAYNNAAKKLHGDFAFLNKF